MYRLAWLLGGWVTLAGGCGDGGAAPASDGGADATAMDAGDMDAGPDPVDAGPPPGCALETLSTTLASGFLGEREGDPEALVAVGSEGPFAFGWRSSTGRMGGRVGRVEVLLVDTAGSEVGGAVVGEARGTTERLGQVALAPAAGGVLVAWEHALTDADGTIEDAQIRHAGVAPDGEIVRPESVLYDHAAVPVLASDPPDDLWMLRSDLTFVGEVTGVSPQLQHLDGAGDPRGDSVPASSFLRIEATELALRTAGDGLVMAYRVPPSTALLVPLDRTPVPTRPERMVYDVPFLDDVAAREDAVALAWTETSGGTARIGVVVTDREGHVLGRVSLDAFDATYTARVAVTAAWPGFVAVWRAGTGADATLRAAGLDARGGVVVDPVDLATVPHLVGDVLLVSDGTELTVGYRVAPPGMEAALGVTRACVPR